MLLQKTKINIQNDVIDHQSASLSVNEDVRIYFKQSNRCSNALKCQKWAIKTLFTIQMGNEIEKEELGTKILNINIETYRNVFKTHSTSLPCVYLTELGKVKDLKDTFNIRDDIYKFGFTDDIDRRLSEHQSDYGKLKNVNLQLTKFTIVEQRYKVEAEKDLRQFFETFNKRLIIKINKLLKNQLKIQELEHINKYKDLELKMKDMEIACLRNNIKL